MRRVDIIIRTGFFIMLTFLLVFLEMRWLIAALLAVLFHEIGHITAMTIMKIRVKSVTLDATGVTIAYMGKYTPYIFDIFAALAGPMVNFLLAAISCCIYRKSGAEFFGVFMVFNLSLGVFNLFPIKYLDGGKILYSTMAIFTDLLFAERMLYVFSNIFTMLVLFLGVYLFYATGFNITMLLASIWLLYLVNKPEMV